MQLRHPFGFRPAEGDYQGESRDMQMKPNAVIVVGILLRPAVGDSFFMRCNQ